MQVNNDTKEVIFNVKKLASFIDDLGVVVEFVITDVKCPHCGKSGATTMLVDDYFVSWCSCGCVFQQRSVEHDIEILSIWCFRNKDQ